MSASLPPVVCTLTTKAAAAQALEWTDLHPHVSSSERLPDGVLMRLPLARQDAILDLVERERSCCAFLDIETSVEGNELVVQITSTNPDARPVIAMLSGSTT